MRRICLAIMGVGLLLGGAPIALAESGDKAAQAFGPGTCKAPITIGANDSALRDAFNQARGSVRLVFLIDPSCSYCLRGLADLDKALLSHHDSNRSLRTIVVHVPVVGAKQADTANTCKLVHNRYVKHYWDPSGDTGRVFSTGLGLKDRNGAAVYAWDVWLVYGADAEWVGVKPPQPDLLMHHLPNLEGYPRLNAARFADEVEKRLKTKVGTP